MPVKNICFINSLEKSCHLSENYTLQYLRIYIFRKNLQTINFSTISTFCSPTSILYLIFLSNMFYNLTLVLDGMKMIFLTRFSIRTAIQLSMLVNKILCELEVIRRKKGRTFLAQTYYVFEQACRFLITLSERYKEDFTKKSGYRSKTFS